MLQQTRVGAVIPYYERFLERFPTLESLAVADEVDVLHAWSGLGYYTRARNLKRAAEIILREHEGHVPREAGALEALPGIGRYTAGAVRSIAFGERAALVDGNVERVLCRLQALLAPSRRTLWALAEALVPAELPGDFNQALMELGAEICTPRAPDCPVCPVCDLCRGLESEAPEQFPAAKARPRPLSIRAVAALVRRPSRRNAILLMRRPSRGLLGGLWELPNVEGNEVDSLIERIDERCGIRTTPGRRLGQVEHAFTHRALTLEIVELIAEGPCRLRRGDGSVKWCLESALGEIPLSTLTRKTLRVAGVTPRAIGTERRARFRDRTPPPNTRPSDP
jgi:A/G-specific adenine glycosylase